MASHTFLFEIGTEELPPGFLSTIDSWIKNHLTQALKDALIPADSIEVYTTARRIGILLNGLPTEQPDQTENLTGPPLRIAKDKEGNWSKAALAFSKKCAVEPEQLETKDNGKEECLGLTRTVEGKQTPDVLKAILPTMLDAMQGPRFMRWGDHSIRFPRPIQWLTALWDDQTLPVTYHHLTASNTSRGHRFLAHKLVTFTHASQYLVQLRTEGHVIASPKERRTTIEQDLANAAKKLDGTLMPNEDLLDEVCQLVESPSVITGNFDTKYLKLPTAVVQTVLASHQKYFTIEKNGKLLPHFLAISNAAPEAAHTICTGYEKVVVARLSDAEFFFAEDQKKPLSQRIDDLSGMTFQRKLGTMKDKTERLITLARIIGQQTDLNDAELQQLVEAAQLSKTDLTTHMVFEFTELEGTIGTAYALHQGIHPAVAHAIEEHYQPRFQGDELPQSLTGALLSITDKVDTLATVLSQEKVSMPTGSKDPIGLRRMVNGLLLTLNHHGFNLSIKESVQAAYDALTFENKTDFNTLWHERLRPFILQRLNSLLSDEGFRPDQIEFLCDLSALNKDVLDDLPDLFNRGQQLKQLETIQNTLHALYTPANRLSRILAKQGTLAELVKTPINPSHFEHDEERELFSLTQVSIQNISELANWQPAIDQFFDKVLVNADNPTIKANRLSLLAHIYTPYAQLGNWGHLQLEKATPAEPATV